ncbi:hypothetical protein HNQ91_000343 [Filimonas zeae]|uniref:DUF6436 domain-containing protein n=1 Tax=Filimonas zeae TaxID=1737353 RepID=A0A917INT6_9BACT|nr:thioredoxin fold domain-containing protein [Filimonas zeae]MDR6337321.1 hypothetical protein [Filimonas zeae]GGH58038.1 hypothetical protein GCM10011379_03370 [Filimonas zeae]
MRKKLVIAWLLVLLCGVIALFWRNEWVYALPTPVPAGYKPVATGTPVVLPAAIAMNGNKPVLLHFFNPDCPCSRFNIPHFASLVNKYGKQASFAIVLMTSKKYTQEEIQQRFHVNVPVLTDTSLATACGVYATPQAVILNGYRQLHFRGNYNKSRYCTDIQTNYAEIALNALLHNTIVPVAPEATKAYGCQLPNSCKK